MRDKNKCIVGMSGSTWEGDHTGSKSNGFVSLMAINTNFRFQIFTNTVKHHSENGMSLKIAWGYVVVKAQGNKSAKAQKAGEHLWFL